MYTFNEANAVKWNGVMDVAVPPDVGSLLTQTLHRSGSHVAFEHSTVYTVYWLVLDCMLIMILSRNSKHRHYF